MRHLLLVAVACLGFPLAAEAKYRPLDLDDLLQKSDLVLYGKIIALHDTTFELQIEKVVAGEYKPAESLPRAAGEVAKQDDAQELRDEAQDIIVVRRFRDWACARRWTPYAKNQRLLLCLKRERDKDTKRVSYRIRSGGGEGEMPIIGTDVYVHGPSRLEIQRQEHSTVWGGKIRGQRVSLDEIRRLTALLRAQQVPEEPATGKADRRRSR